mmetsp:Transcript_5955/g.11285  ORF Transcript_5955/g.11285 Transcript_5955/m.11285 type:complete len:266 (+) Transcript_5955:193-990(+)|eukprot:CAMPEP_0182454846 /NCGR_PEP_ID=MMETSP1319-20130603/1291_1 /TAXON_ID=172717 /ORGANISM="Bolidomonas pacifica, Strain RCC208" /LENGTH=265 /DNA_ID=CAMNT_0024652871 /DNA_START=180 /DNA_END=977 /DNA_ORIENTATION=+
MGGGGSKGYGPPPREFIDYYPHCANSKGNFQIIVTDGKETYTEPLEWDGKAIVVGRSSTAGATIKVADEGTSAQHLEFRWVSKHECWQAKDMGSSKGTRILRSERQDPASVPDKLDPETPFNIESITVFHCGISTFVALVPTAKKIGLICTKNDEATVTNLKVGDFVPFTNVLSMGREPSPSGQKCLRFPGVSNISGAHCCIERNGKHWELTDSDATHKTVIAGHKLTKGGNVPLWPGATITFGHKEKNFDSASTIHMKVMMQFS